jgi:DNA-binding XRE family transcriptional regulator
MNLKEWRSANSINQANFAKLVNTTQPHISAIERGEDCGSLELSTRIFKKTGVATGKLKSATPDQLEALVSFVDAAQ